MSQNSSSSFLKFDDFFHQKKREYCETMFAFLFHYSQNFAPKNTLVDTKKTFRDIVENKLEHN